MLHFIIETEYKHIKFILIISILLPDLRGGGAERVSLDLAHQFVKLGHAVEFVLMSASGEFLNEARRDFSVHSLAAKQTRNIPFRLASYLKNREPDVLIANMWPLTSAAAIGRLLSGRKCLLLLVEHTTLSLMYASWGGFHKLNMRASMMITYRLADQIAAVSQGSAIDTARLARLAEERVQVLYNPIPKRNWPCLDELAEADRLWGCPKGERILTVGSLKDSKNYRLLQHAFARLERPNARLMFIGDGDNRKTLHTQAIELGIHDRVIFSGFHADPSPFYATADLFVLSSDYEGFGNVIVEALSFGLRIVSTDCQSGPSEILENGRLGRLVPVGNVVDLEKAMEESLSIKADTTELKRRATDFSPEIAACRYLQLLGF